MTSALRGTATIILLLLNLCFWGVPVLTIGLLKLVTRGAARRRVIVIVTDLTARWVATNDAIFDLMLPTVWDIDGIGDMDRDGRYLIVSNHVSWVDIFVVLRVFHGRLAFPRFFLKRELAWFPIIGQAAWALDYPFMRRYTAEYLAVHPEKRGKDLETTRRACQRYRDLPVAVLNYLEGTRFSEEKRADQDSPYAHLLRPRVGGVAFVLACLGDQLDGVIDVTIAYPGHLTTTWDFVSGGIDRISVRARRFEIPTEFLNDRITEPGPERDNFKEWIEQIWREKDELLSRLTAPAPTATESLPARREIGRG